jgi:hypothetical protein
MVTSLMEYSNSELFEVKRHGLQLIVRGVMCTLLAGERVRLDHDSEIEMALEAEERGDVVHISEFPAIIPPEAE